MNLKERLTAKMKNPDIETLSIKNNNKTIPKIAETKNNPKEDNCCGEIAQLKTMMTAMTKESVEIVKLSREILKRDLSSARQYIDITNSHLSIKKENDKITRSLRYMRLKYALFYIALGGVAVKVFPIVVPYAKWLLNFILKGV
jgi:hypothetical protein